MPRALRRRCGPSLALLLVMGVASAADRSPIIQLELPLLDGSRFVRLKDMPGRAVLLNFWGSECIPCAQELPLLEATAQKHPGTQFIGIAVDDRDSAHRFLARFKISYPQLIATMRPEVLMRRLGNTSGALPYTVLLDRAHRLCSRRLGQIDAGWIEQELARCGM